MTGSRRTLCSLVVRRISDASSSAPILTASSCVSSPAAPWPPCHRGSPGRRDLAPRDASDPRTRSESHRWIFLGATFLRRPSRFLKTDAMGRRGCFAGLAHADRRAGVNDGAADDHPVSMPPPRPGRCRCCRGWPAGGHRPPRDRPWLRTGDQTMGGRADPTALLHWFRRSRIRWGTRDDIHEAFLKLACALICWRRLRTPLCEELRPGGVVQRHRAASTAFSRCFTA